ncbi:MAG: YlbF family regulator [Syntrophomonadaceae bacterium]|jgi:cell fate (sporulation/competence/biofilm development) regulator YlbF (YheA/YmcA/DUF963 family)
MADSNPFDKAHELARSIRQSPAYERYLCAKREIDKHPDYKDKILKVRSRQMELNRAHILGEELPADSVAELSQELSALKQHEEIAEFFEAETCYINMFQDIQNIIQSALDADLRD